MKRLTFRQFTVLIKSTSGKNRTGLEKNKKKKSPRARVQEQTMIQVKSEYVYMVQQKREGFQKSPNRRILMLITLVK